MATESIEIRADDGIGRLRQLAWGYIPAALIGVIVELGIPDLLLDGMKTAGELSAATQTNEDALYRVLRTLAGFGICTENGARTFALTSAGRYLRSDVPDSIRGYVLWVTSPFLIRNYAALMHAVKTGGPTVDHVFGRPFFSHLQSDPELTRTFNEGMTSFSEWVSSAVLSAYDFSGIKILADLAGGEGALLAAIVGKYPEMRGLLFEQDHVLQGARRRFQALGLADRCSCAAVDFFQEVPPGADVYLMKSIIHDWDDKRAQVILRNCREALRNIKSGKLLLVEAVIPSGSAFDMSKIFDMQMMVIAGGRERTQEEFQRLLADSGFRMTAVLSTQSVLSIVEAVPE